MSHPLSKKMALCTQRFVHCALLNLIIDLRHFSQELTNPSMHQLIKSEVTALLKVANHFYKNSPGNWICLRIDPKLLGASRLVYEPAAPVGEKVSATFKHDGKECLCVYQILRCLRASFSTLFNPNAVTGENYRPSHRGKIHTLILMYSPAHLRSNPCVRGGWNGNHRASS